MKQKVHFGYLLFLSFVAAWGGFLFGYDEAVISGTISEVSAQFNLNDGMKGWFVSSALLGAIIGVIFGGALGDNIGRKKTMILSAVLFTVSMIGCAISNSFIELVLYRIVGGMGIGLASIVCPLYISEISVPQHRGLLVSLYQLAVTIGVVAAYIINDQLLSLAQEGEALGNFFDKIFITEYWRGMLGMGVIPSMFFLIIVLCIPESPRWLITKGRVSRAENIFGRIYCSKEDVGAQIAATQEVSKPSGSEKSEIKMLFQPGIFKALIIGMAIAI